MNSPYQTPIMNNYLPQYGAYQYNPMANIQRFQQSDQMQPQMSQLMPQQINFIGKIVDGEDTVKATDIPMDGNIYYFPKADGTEIYGKQWIVNEGRTRILTFKPVDPIDNKFIKQSDKIKI